MRIRIEGRLDETDVAIKKIRGSFIVYNVSRPYKNRGTDYYRIYLDVEPKI